MFLHTGEEKVRSLLNVVSLVDLPFLVLPEYVYMKWKKAEPVKWGKYIFSWCLQTNQQPFGPIWVFRCVRGEPWGLFPFAWTPVLMLCSDLFHASFFLIPDMVGLHRLVMLGCVGWDISGKDKGKNWAENVNRVRDVRRIAQGRPSCVRLGDSCFSTATS